jgi:ketosteroid isomerase-like protein
MAGNSSHKNFVARLIDGWNSGELNVIDEMFTPNFVRHGDHIGGKKEIRGPDAYKQVVSEFRKLISDFQTEAVDIIENGNKVVLRFHTTGSNQGKPIDCECVNVFRIEGELFA